MYRRLHLYKGPSHNNVTYFLVDFLHAERGPPCFLFHRQHSCFSRVFLLHLHSRLFSELFLWPLGPFLEWDAELSRQYCGQHQAWSLGIPPLTTGFFLVQFGRSDLWPKFWVERSCVRSHPINRFWSLRQGTLSASRRVPARRDCPCSPGRSGHRFVP